MKKIYNEIQNSWAVEAVQVVANYCLQNSRNCKECMFRMKNGSCLFRGEIIDRFNDWKKENNIDIVNRR